jgi:hypothetical protein
MILSEHAAITGEADTYYRSSQRESLLQNFILGPQFTFRNEEAKLRPFLYDQSVFNARRLPERTITHSFNLRLGGGVESQAAGPNPFQITPAEYFLRSCRTPTHSYMGLRLHSLDCLEER